MTDEPGETGARKGEVLSGKPPRDRRVLRRLRRAFHLRKFRNTLAASIPGGVRTSLFFAEPGYGGVLEASLHGDNIPPEVCSTVVDTVNKGLMPPTATWREKSLGLTSYITTLTRLRTNRTTPSLRRGVDGDRGNGPLGPLRPKL